MVTPQSFKPAFDANKGAWKNACPMMRKDGGDFDCFEDIDTWGNFNFCSEALTFDNLSYI